jgi:hypothetical protein
MTSTSDAPSQPGGFEGEVSGLGLSDIIQINARNGFSGCIRVQNGVLRGVIYFRDGAVVHAEQGERTGEEGFIEIIGWRGGRFTVENNVVTALRTISKGCEHLLLDAHRILDERRAHPPAPAAKPAPAARPSPEATVERARTVPGVSDAVVITRAGAPVGKVGYQAEVLAGQAQFLGLLGAELGAAFEVGELRSATAEGARGHLLLYYSRTHGLGVIAAPAAAVGAVDAGLRSTLGSER